MSLRATRRASLQRLAFQTWKMASLGCFVPGVLLVLTLVACRIDRSSRMSAFPKVMLWAWERPEDLRSLPVKRCGVAYLAQTAVLQGNQARFQPRMQPLRIPPGTALMAVTRIEVDHRAAFRPDARLRDVLVAGVLSRLRPEVRGVQIDFDARASERDFYRELLVELRRRLDPGMPLSMTSLASWALFEDWLDTLPVDEAVPMCFDMGADAGVVRMRLAAGQDFRPKVAREAIGLRMGEPRLQLPAASRHPRRVYLFQHTPWSDQSLHRALSEFEP